MRITILGCGEAFDERLPNTHLLVEAAGQTILCDCGYSAPRQIWAHTDANAIDLVYISHAHADHYFGLPALLGRMWEDGREKPLAILSQAAVLDQIKDLLEYGYRTLPSRYRFPIEWRAAKPGEAVAKDGITFDFAETMHAVSNLAVRMRVDGKTFCYSGDGMFTKQSAALFAGAGLVAHEAFCFNQSPVHADIGGLIAMAGEQGIERLALVHVQRDLRREPRRIHETIAASAGAEVTLPEPREIYEI